MEGLTKRPLAATCLPQVEIFTFTLVLLNKVAVENSGFSQGGNPRNLAVRLF